MADFEAIPYLSSYSPCLTIALIGYAVSGRFSFLHPPHGSFCFGLCCLPPRHLHAMNPLLPRCSFRANSFDYYQLAHGHPNTYTYAVRYITTRRPPAHGEEGHNPTEAQSRFSRRDAHSTPAHRRFQIHQEPFQPAFRCAQNPQEERPRGAHHHEFQNQGRAGTASCVL